MPPGNFNWISAAEDCHIWDDNFGVVHKFDRAGNAVLDVAWSQDGKNLAYISKGSNQIITSTICKQIALGNTTLVEDSPTALGYSNDTLIAGTNSGTVLLWDQQKHKLIRKYGGADKSAVCRIQTNSSVIASGHAGGAIQIYGLKTGQLMEQYSIANSAGLRDMKISLVKNSLLAAAFNSGTVAAWNTCSNKGTNSPMVEFIAAHQSPATSIALSPITDILMVSGGLDKNIILYDCPKKKILKKIETDAPITAIDFFPDGTSLIVGTNRGKILIYDLRSISSPIQTISAHTTSITRVICRAQTSTQKKSEPIKIACKTEEPKTSLPTKEISDSRFPFPSPATKLLSTPSFGHSIPDSASAVNETERKNSSLFSPLKGETSRDLYSSPSFAASPLLRFKSRELEESLPKPEPSIREELPSTSSTISFNNQPALEEEKTPKEATPPSMPVDFQAEFIRRIVHEVEDNLREVLRCRFGDLIIQSAQQFLTLQNELEQLKQQVQDKAYLEEEVRRLRTEVNQLRNLY